MPQLIDRFLDALRADLMGKAPWKLLFALVVGMYVAAFLLQRPLHIEATVDRLPPSATGLDRAEIREMLRAETVLRAVVLVVRLAAGWAAFAGMVWFLCRSFAPPVLPRFSQVFALQVRAATIGATAAVGSAVISVSTQAYQPAALETMLSLRGPVGQAGEGLWGSLLASANLVTLGIVGVLSAGIVVLCGFRWRTGVLLAATSWSLSWGWNMFLLSLLRTALHLSF